MLKLDRSNILVFAGLAALSALWLWYGAYQSHYLIGLGILGDTTTTNLFGVAKEGRGDEWSTYIPFLKQAYMEGFPKQSSLGPYFERFDYFISIPRADLSLLFMPNHALYFVLPGWLSLSFQGLYYNLLLLFSVVWLLRNLEVRLAIALPAAVMLLFSHLYQVWWTSNFPALASSILPFAILTARLQPATKCILIALSVGHLLFGQLYPGFYIPIVACLLPVVLAVRPDLIKLKEIAPVALGALVGVGAFVVLRWDFLISAMGTSYPANRFETGGGEALHVLLPLIFPTAPVPMTGPETSLYGRSLAGTMLPLIAAVSVFRSPLLKRDVILLAVAIVTTVFVMTFMTIGFPGWLSRATLFSHVQPRRMLIGLSLLAFVCACVILSRNWEKLGRLDLIIVAGVLTIGVVLFGVRPDFVEAFPLAEFYPYAVVGIIATAVALSFVTAPQRRSNLSALVTLTLISGLHVLTFGSFNPLMDARTILLPVSSPLVEDMREIAARQEGKEVAILGNFGHLLRGEGLPAINAIHMANVDFDRYRQSLVGIASDKVDEQFNRFIGISVANITEAKMAGLSLSLPAWRNIPAEEHELVAITQTNVLPGEAWIDDIVAEDDAFVLFWRGMVPAAGEPVPQITTTCPVVSSWVGRYPLPWKGEITGFAGRTVVKTTSEEQAGKCISAMSVAR